MSYTIANYNDAVTRAIHGRSTSRLQDPYENAYDASLILNSELDLMELQRQTQISPQIFEDVLLYASPSDYKGLIDLSPSAGRKAGYESQSDFRRTGQRELSIRQHIDAPLISEKWVDGTLFFVINAYPGIGSRIQLESFDATTDFTEGGDIGTLAQNSLNYWEGGASLSFALDGLTGTGTLQKTITTQDLTNYKLLASWFLKVWIPSGFSSRFTSFKIQHGNSDGVDWSKTVTTQHDGTAFKDGLNILRFDWSSATEAGSVDETLMNFMKLTVVYSTGSAIPGVLVDDFNIQLGTMFDIDYYSNYFFKSAAGTFLDKPTADTDTVNLSPESYRLFVDIGTMCAMREISSLKDELDELKKSLGYPLDPDNIYKGTLGNYRRKHPSESPVKSSTVYDFGV